MTDPRAGRGGGEAAPPLEAPQRPPRPWLVTVTSAFLVVDGLVSAVLSLDLAGRLADTTPGIEPLALLSVGLGLATTVLGVLLHFGRGWIVAINVSAVAGFLELTSNTPAGWITGVIDVGVVLLLLWTRPWFAWSPDGDDEEGGGGQEEDGTAA